MSLYSPFLQLLQIKKDKTITGKGEIKSSTKAFLLATSFVLIFVAACRYHIGTDYGGYYKGLKLYAPRLQEAIKNFDEPGVPLLATIIKWFTNDGAWLVAACSILTIGLFLLTIYRNTESFLMASLLFAFICWCGTFNGVRQYFAAAILFAGYRFIRERKLIKWGIIVFFAACFHISAVLMFLLYFLLPNKVTLRNVILLTVGTLIVSANYDTIFSLVGFLKGTELGRGEYITRSVNVLRIIISCAPAVAVLVIYINKQPNSEESFFINALIVHRAAMLSASDSAYLARIGIYTSPYVCIALPKLIRLKNLYYEQLLRIGIVILYGVFFILKSYYVAAEYRRQGIAGKLLSAAIADREMPWDRVFAVVKEENLPSVHTLEKHSFKPVGYACKKGWSHQLTPKKTRLLVFCLSRSGKQEYKHDLPN